MSESESAPTPARRERRRHRARREFDDSVPSPCIGVCQLDETSGYCRGCLRDTDEIRDWMIMSAEEKRAVLARLDARRPARRDDGGR